MSDFLAFVECAGCGESFPVRRKMALNRAKWCSERCRKAQYAGICVDCGGPTSPKGHGADAPRRCGECSIARIAALSKERGRQRRELVERLWAKGLTAREIAQRLGWTVKQPGTYLCNLRARGYDLPHRRTPEQLARLSVGAAERLAKARSMKRAA